jgi:phage terminase large subunit
MIEHLAPFKPLSWQIEPWRDKALLLLATGSAGGGKSRLCGEKVHAFMQKYDGATGLMLRKAREYASKSIVPFMEYTVIGDDPGVKKHKVDMFFEYGNGSRLYWGGMKDDGQREAIRSMGGDGSLDIVWIEEANAFVRADLDEVLARMRGKAAPWVQVMLSTNPDAPMHWIYQDLILGGEASVYYSRAADNPYNPASYAATLGNLKGILHDRLVLGLWKQAEGAVYDEFDTSLHVVSPFEIPADWRRIRAVDFGYTNPLVCQWWAIDNDGRMYLYRELYRTKALVEDVARDIVRLSEGERVEATVCDHDAEDRATLERHGVSTIAAKKDIGTGIQAVKQRLAEQEDERPRLYLFSGALVEEDEALKQAKAPTSTEAEITGYVWPKASDGKPIKEVPVKVHDHGMDAMRYGVMYLDGSGPAAGETVEVQPAQYRPERRSVLWSR